MEKQSFCGRTDMNLQNAQEQVSTWMKTFGQDVPDSLTMPDLDTRKLRAKLILEEALETITKGLGIHEVYTGGINGDCYAFDEMLDCIKNGEFDSFAEPNLEQTRDGLADLLVVTLGTSAACGIDAQSDFNEVMRSNNSKMWTDEEVKVACAMTDKEFCEAVKETCDGALFPVIKFPIPFSYKAKKVNTELRCWIVKDASGKICKSPSFSRPDFDKPKEWLSGQLAEPWE